MKPGGGGRFAKLKSSLKGKVSDPGAVAAAIGRKKYGHAKFQAMAAKGKRRVASSHPKHNSEAVEREKAERRHVKELRMHSHGKIRGLGGEVRRPATRSHAQGKSFAENLTGRKY
jgi:hypothetical protein